MFELRSDTCTRTGRLQITPYEGPPVNKPSPLQPGDTHKTPLNGEGFINANPNGHWVTKRCAEWPLGGRQGKQGTTPRRRTESQLTRASTDEQAQRSDRRQEGAQCLTYGPRPRPHALATLSKTF